MFILQHIADIVKINILWVGGGYLKIVFVFDIDDG